MADIFHNFPIAAPANEIFKAVSTPRGLDSWWTDRSTGEPRLGAEYELWFGPEYDWRAVITNCSPDREFELQMSRADHDWTGSRVGFSLDEANGITQVRFHHTGWPQANEHYCTSSFCWAMYLRLMKKHVETGEVVPHKIRLDV